MYKEIKSSNSRISTMLLMLVVIFVGFLMMSNILANRMVQLWIFSIDAGTLTFPVTYILSDVFSEVYGYKWSRRVTWIAAGMNLIFSLLIMIACVLPHPDWYDASPFTTAIGSSYRIVVASLVSYVCGDFVNDRVFRAYKRRKPGLKHFSIRAIMSSFYGEIVDTSLFVLIAFLGTMPTSEMLPMILINIIIKTGYEAIILPITCKITRWVHTHEGEQYEL